MRKKLVMTTIFALVSLYAISCSSVQRYPEQKEPIELNPAKTVVIAQNNFADSDAMTTAITAALANSLETKKIVPALPEKMSDRPRWIVQQAVSYNGEINASMKETFSMLTGVGKKLGSFDTLVVFSVERSAGTGGMTEIAEYHALVYNGQEDKIVSAIIMERTVPKDADAQIAAVPQGVDSAISELLGQ